jgi:hypothetical protein
MDDVRIERTHLAGTSNHALPTFGLGETPTC